MTRDPLYGEALERFQRLLERAVALGLRDPTAAALATVDDHGQPSVRIVLLRGWDPQGFVFYTNSRSEKGRQLAKNPQGALCLYWDALQEQVRIEGRTEFVDEAMCDDYWVGRPRLSQLASVASDQSSVLNDRTELEDRVAALDRQFSGQPVPRPSHWRGYRLAPTRIEFWIGREGRMHERTQYQLLDGTWRKSWLYP